MKVKVLIDFIDKETRKIHRKGEVIDLPEERFKEINKIVKRVQAVKAESAENKAEKQGRIEK